MALSSDAEGSGLMMLTDGWRIISGSVLTVTYKHSNRFKIARFIIFLITRLFVGTTKLVETRSCCETLWLCLMIPNKQDSPISNYITNKSYLISDMFF